MSKFQKVFIWILGILLVLVIGVTGIAAKVYLDVKGSIKDTYETVERQETGVKRKKEVDLNKKDSFSILLMGVDTGDLGRTDTGRSDAIMVATVSPEDNKTQIVSIPRDTYMEIVGHGTNDKINHAYAFGGPAMAMDSLEKYLDIPIDHYASINMQGIKDLVDAVGGVTVNNDLEFTNEGHTFGMGKIQINGEQALAFVRMRYDDPRGDYGRQERQRLVVEGIAKKLISLSGVTQYQAVLDAVAANMRTDMDFGMMQKIALEYRSAFNTIQMDQMKGEGFMQDGVSYQRVSDEEKQRVQTELKDQLNID
ncbi:LCP family protein [Enterococcus alcedinis]|uniref:Polyisoprenyl-teichoic acid--peptidoglycan teichoic acid transferase TagU n=1 Tax=Enterococcus alcedinis TaxID=1274384 RepID=A0A917N5P4_9ENTE|nr:LCP family protein [Enterococcus alcedinis]MBP2102758.1 LCP family protein required for cell wall assembly [Enterococcus alcedinis]GGI66319.1 transcriptional regulator [Enterococcus alcedinis]